IQRVSAALASPVDLEEAYATGAHAVRHAVEGKSGYMVTLEREAGSPYVCRTGIVSLEEVANREKKLPRAFINERGDGVTRQFLEYVTPLIGGPLPEYARLERHFVGRRPGGPCAE
ncbi:MAG: 6-phosphofructokinase, partial [Proteobacteria bacterium]|nr:6-phosphofructokinase [Pseudomonadota bacterium]